MRDLLKSNKIEWFLVLWLLAFLSIYALVLLSADKVKLNIVWDAMSGIFWTLISTLVFIFVVQSYSLQKEELKKTTEALEGQESAMKEQKMQSLVIELLTLSQSHIENFRNDLRKLFTSSNTDPITLLYNSYSSEGELIQNIKNWRLNNLISYFRTLKHIESLLILNYADNRRILQDYIELLDSQITDNIRSLYDKLIKVKTGIDLEKIRFEYLFKPLPPSFEEKKIRQPRKTITRKLSL